MRGGASVRGRGGEAGLGVTPLAALPPLPLLPSPRYANLPISLPPCCPCLASHAPTPIRAPPPRPFIPSLYPLYACPPPPQSENVLLKTDATRPLGFVCKVGAI